jgi:hypothetical protein
MGNSVLFHSFSGAQDAGAVRELSLEDTLEVSSRMWMENQTMA